MHRATSSGAPIRPRRCMAIDARSAASFRVIRSANGVSTGPGATALNRNRFDAYVAAAALTSPFTPALAVT